MSTPVQIMLADIDRKIANLTDLRKNLVQFEIDFPHSAASLVPINGDGAPSAPKRGPYKTRKAAKKADGRTDGRTDGAKRRPARGGTFDQDGAGVLDALKANGGSMKPSDLAGALRVALPTLRRWIAPLVDAKKVIATGTTASRRFSLPGRVPKEVP